MKHLINITLTAFRKAKSGFEFLKFGFWIQDPKPNPKNPKPKNQKPQTQNPKPQNQRIKSNSLLMSNGKEESWKITKSFTYNKKEMVQDRPRNRKLPKRLRKISEEMDYVLFNSKLSNLLAISIYN